jgi:hypothetical protein
MNIPQLPELRINTIGESRDIDLPGTREKYTRNAHVQMVSETDFSRLPRGDIDGIC